MSQTPSSTPETAISLLCTATMKAYIKISRDRNLPVDCEKATADMRTTLKANIDKILAEWKDATDAHMSEAWLHELMNAQAIQMALEALKL